VILSARPERLNNNIRYVLLLLLLRYRIIALPTRRRVDIYSTVIKWTCTGCVWWRGGAVEIYYYTVDRARVNMTYAADGGGGLKRLRLCGFTAHRIYLYVRYNVYRYTHALLNDDL